MMQQMPAAQSSREETDLLEADHQCGCKERRSLWGKKGTRIVYPLHWPDNISRDAKLVYRGRNLTYQEKRVTNDYGNELVRESSSIIQGDHVEIRSWTFKGLLCNPSLSCIPSSLCIALKLIWKQTFKRRGMCNWPHVNLLCMGKIEEHPLSRGNNVMSITLDNDSIFRCHLRKKHVTRLNTNRRRHFTQCHRGDERRTCSQNSMSKTVFGSLSYPHTSLK